MRAIRGVRAMVELGRPKFLIGGFVLHALGVTAALYDGATLSLAALAWGQIAITGAQLMTHFANDYFDLRADAANTTPTNWSGGSRVLVDRKLPARAALGAALLLAAISFSATVYLSTAIRPGLLTFGVLFTAQALAWFYSAPPFRLHSSGFGELTTALVVTGMTPLTGYVLQTGTVGLSVLLACAPLCCMQVAMLLAVEFPDTDGDALAGKRTLVVRVGRARGAVLYAALIAGAYLTLPLLVAAGLPVPVALAAGATVPLGMWQLRRVVRGDWRNPARWNRLAFYTIVLLMLTAAAEAAAFFLLSGL